MRSNLTLRMNGWILTSLMVVACASSSLDENWECPFEDIDFQPCVAQLSAKSIWSCCEILNQAIIEDHHCVCKLIGSKTPLLTHSLLLTMSDCLISIPQCHEEQVPGDEAGEGGFAPTDWEPAASSSYKNLTLPKLNDDSPPPAKNATTSSSSVVNQPGIVAPVLGVLTSSSGNHSDTGIWLQTITLLLPLASSFYKYINQ